MHVGLAVGRVLVMLVEVITCMVCVVINSINVAIPPVDVIKCTLSGLRVCLHLLGSYD